MVRHASVVATLLSLLALCCCVFLSFSAVQVEAAGLRREDETWRLLGEATEGVAPAQPALEDESPVGSRGRPE
ncbi:hypothetical protein PINS_up016734 [Pythium insidiosum]|nr:hypothetical protein PINS_up016734 [Pythium insidiosum]